MIDVPPPKPDEAVLVVANLDDVDPSYADALSPDEASRASRYRHAVDRRRFQASRGLLRHVIGRWTGVPARLLTFDYGPRGKPTLVAPRADVRFNLSHSGPLLVIAFTRGCEVGVDVELTGQPLDTELLARRFTGTPESDFLRAWVRREAVAKWSGSGLGDVTQSTSEPAVRDFEVGTRAIGSLATGQPVRRLDFHVTSPATFNSARLVPHP